jgi:hypothetical protein
MKKLITFILPSIISTITLFPNLAFASAPKFRTRLFHCEGISEIKMEVFGPRDITDLKPNEKVMGYYSLDLTPANKGKSLEPVYLSLTANRKSVRVDQYLRKLIPVEIALTGKTLVGFDNRFGDGAECEYDFE